MPITLNPTLLGQSDHLISPARHLLAIDNNPWNATQSSCAAPEPHELPLPDKLLPKGDFSILELIDVICNIYFLGGMSDDSGDSGVNIILENSPSDNEVDPSSSENQGKVVQIVFWLWFFS